MFERWANHSAAHDACGPEQDTTACFPRCIRSAVSAFFRAGLGGGLRGGCIGGLAKTSPYSNCSRTGLWSEVSNIVSQHLWLLQGGGSDW